MNAARRRVLAAALAASLAGCSLAPVDVAVHTSVIEALPAEIPRRPASDAVLLVLATDAAGGYDTAQMAYSKSPHELAYFSRNEWAQPPARMLNGLAVRTLEATARFRAVATPPYTGSFGFALGTELLELRQDFTTEPPILHLRLHAQLRDGQGRALATREFAEEEPMSARSPQAGVEAANAAAARMLRELAAFVIEAAR